MIGHSAPMLLLITLTLGIFQNGQVLGGTHECTCEYTAQFPGGQCNCVPPLPGPGAGGHPPEIIVPTPSDRTAEIPHIQPPRPGETGIHKCTCEYTAQFPGGQCTCVPPLPGAGHTGGYPPEIIVHPSSDRKAAAIHHTSPPRPVETGIHKCTCEYTAQYPGGQCTCVPPLPGAGHAGGYPPEIIVHPSSDRKAAAIHHTSPPRPVETGIHKCTCEYTAQSPGGHCTCVPPLPGSN